MLAAATIIEATICNYDADASTADFIFDDDYEFKLSASVSTLTITAFWHTVTSYDHQLKSNASMKQAVSYSYKCTDFPSFSYVAFAAVVVGHYFVIVERAAGTLREASYSSFRTS